jgi:hypothetical protein
MQYTLRQAITSCFCHWQAVEIPHYAPIANIIQMASFWRVNDDDVPWESRKTRQGDVALAGESNLVISRGNKS